MRQRDNRGADFAKCPRQRGVVLVVALVVLLVMTGIGVTIMSGSTLQERMAGNSRQLSVARSNAEAAIRAAERYLVGLNIKAWSDFYTPFSGNNDGLFLSVIDQNSGIGMPGQQLVTLDLNEPTNWDVSGLGAVTVTAMSSGAKPPKYVIDYIGRMEGMALKSPSVDIENKDKLSISPYAFRITAIGYGQSEKITSVLHSIYITEQ